jgi:Ca2+-binding RTX toxin-like protein
LTLTLGAEEQTITGGSGDDTFIFAGNLSYEDTVDGGAGTNSISLSSTTGAILSDAATGNVANVTNIQKLTTSGSLTSATITMSELSSLTTIEMDGASAGAVTIAAIPNNATIQVDDEISHTLTLSMAANTSADVLNLKLNEDIDGDIDTGNTYLNTLNITSAGTVDSTWHQIDMGGLTANTVTVAGAVAIDASNEAMATAVTQLDATAATANIKFTAGDNAGTEMLGGSAIDTFVGGSGADILEGNAGADVLTGGAGNDTISGGAGNDSITGGTGNDLLTGGAGDDKFIYTQLSTAVVADGEAFDGSASDGLINSTPDDITESTATSLTGGDFITDFVIGTDIIEIGGAMETAIETGQGAATQVLTTAGTADLTASGYFIVDNSLTTVSDFGDASVVMAAIDAALGTDHNGANADEMIITFSNTANTQHAVYFFYDADENAATTTDDGLSLLAIIDTPGDLLVTSVVDAN